MNFLDPFKLIQKGRSDILKSCSLTLSLELVYLVEKKVSLKIKALDVPVKKFVAVLERVSCILNIKKKDFLTAKVKEIIKKHLPVCSHLFGNFSMPITGNIKKKKVL